MVQDEGPDFDRFIPVHQEPLYTRIIPDVDAELQRRGLFPAPPPLDLQGNIVRPVMPPALSALSGVDVLDLLGQFGAYLEYVAPLVVEYSVVHDAWARTKTHLVSEIRGQLRGSATQVKDAVENDPRYRDVDEKEFRAKSLYLKAAAIEKGAENSRLTVSRAITSQGQELERLGRENNVASNRRGAYGPPRSAGGTPSRVFRP